VGITTGSKEEIVMNLSEMLDQWHKTKSIAIAHDICEELWNEMEAYDEP